MPRIPLNPRVCRSAGPGRELVLSDDERVQLTSLEASRSLPHALVARAKVVLCAKSAVWTETRQPKWRRRQRSTGARQSADAHVPGGKARLFAALKARWAAKKSAPGTKRLGMTEEGRKRLDQALMLRGSRDFATTEYSRGLVTMAFGQDSNFRPVHIQAEEQ